MSRPLHCLRTHEGVPGLVLRIRMMPRMTEYGTFSRLCAFLATSLRKRHRIFWPKNHQEGSLPPEQPGYGWIGRVLRKGDNSITRTAIRWTPAGRRRRRRPKTWRRTSEAEPNNLGHSLDTIERLATDRTAWRNFDAAKTPIDVIKAVSISK